MPPRYQSTVLSFEEKARNLFDHFGQPAHRGHARVNGGTAGLGSGLQSLIQSPAGAEATTEAAHLLVMSATDGSIDSGGDHVTFDEVVDRRGFYGVPVQPGEAWVYPERGTWKVEFEQVWDSYTGGGTVALEIDGSVPPDGVLMSGSSGQKGHGGVPHWIETAGQVGRIKVTQGSGSAKTCTARVRVYLVQRAADDGDVWEKVFDADTWGIVKVGSGWWVTEGASGITVSNLDSSGAVLDSFEASHVAGSDVRVRGIDFDGTDLWVMGDEEIVARYSTAGVWQQTIDLAGTWSEGTGNGLAFDGTDLWLVGNGTDQLRRYTTAGSHEQTINLPSSADHRGIAHYSGRLYVVDTTNSQLLIFSTDGDALGTIDVSGAVSAPTGVWISPLGTLYVSKDGDGIYRRQTEVS